MINLNIDHTLFPEVIIPTDMPHMYIILFETIHTPPTLTPNHTLSLLLITTIITIINNNTSHIMITIIIYNILFMNNIKVIIKHIQLINRRQLVITIIHTE